MTNSKRWVSQSLNEGHWLRFDLAELSLIVLRETEEWRISVLSESNPEIPESGHANDLPDELDWERWDNDPKDSKLQFRPTYPPLPVIARPQSVLNLSSKGSATLFIGIPAWVELIAECQGSMIPLKAFPTEALSKTWHGTNISGSLGYGLKTHARRTFAPEDWPEHDIICSMDIVNQGHTTLPLDRMYLETDHLAVFEGKHRLWSNATRIHVGAKHSSSSNITYASKPGAPYDEASELTAARKGYTRRSTVKTAFSNLIGSFNPLGD